ncbi:MAG TPA: GntR family transcriptional regulator [Sphingomonas sp.]
MGIIVRTLSDQVVEFVRERILSGEVPSDAPIRQDALAAELGISKIPLREALARLEQDGLLQSHPNRGFFVRPMSSAELEEIYALRLKLEPDAVVAGSLKATEADRQRAAAALAEFKRMADVSSVSGGAHNRAFHVALMAPGEERITSDFLERLHVMADRYVCKHLEPLGRSDRADQEHDQLMEAWLAQDIERLRGLASAHIRNTLEDLRQQLR